MASLVSPLAYSRREHPSPVKGVRDEIDARVLRVAAYVLAVLCVALGAILCRILSLENDAMVKSSNDAAEMRLIIRTLEGSAMASKNESQYASITEQITVPLSAAEESPIAQLPPSDLAAAGSGRPPIPTNPVSPKNTALEAKKERKKRKKTSKEQTPILVPPNTTDEEFQALSPLKSSSADIMVFESFTQMREFEESVFPRETVIVEEGKRLIKRILIPLSYSSESTDETMDDPVQEAQTLSSGEGPRGLGNGPESSTLSSNTPPDDETSDADKTPSDTPNVRSFRGDRKPDNVAAKLAGVDVTSATAPVPANAASQEG